MNFIFLQDLLLQMKERCAYMQEVNGLCKDVERATMPGQNNKKNASTTSAGGGGTDNSNQNSKGPGSPSKTNSRVSESSEVKSKLSVSTSSPDLSRKENRTESPSELNPKLVDLATEVKDLNIRFASTCMQAKQHYASLSKVLTASIERHSSLRSVRSSLSSIRSNRSLNGHYVRITQITERDGKDKKGQDITESGSSQSSANSTFEAANVGDTDNSAGKLKNNNNKCADEITSTDAKGESPRSAPTPMDTKNPSATGSQNMTSKLDQSPGRKQGGALTPKASVVSTAGSPPKLGRSSSVSTSTDIDSEIRKRLEEKYPVVLRSKSMSCGDDYTDTQPRSRKRPKSAVVIVPSADGERALMSEVELRRSTGGNRAVKLHDRRSSMEIDLSSLANSGLLLRSNLQHANSPSTPVGFPAKLIKQSSPTKARAFSSSMNLRAGGDRSSVVSIESLDPRTLISGQLHQNSHAFNTSFGPDVANMQLPSFASSEWNRFKKPRQNGNLNVPENLQSKQRSVSMETLTVNKNKGRAICS